MDKKRVLKLLEMIFDTNNKELFIAQMLYEKCESKQDMGNIIDGDFDYAEKIYYKCYLDNDAEISKWNESIISAINGEFDFEEEE